MIDRSVKSYLGRDNGLIKTNVVFYRRGTNCVYIYFHTYTQTRAYRTESFDDYIFGSELLKLNKLGQA